ncbi:rho GTPase-activating protein 31 isoform X1 [Alosa pseudoharengus]|uniref:rho GTPase-activating protein 31 isoform X1 n=1 Tax=Alosa pseudoharengus TaxID=34774 RepID=UPI003F8C4751
MRNKGAKQKTSRKRGGADLAFGCDLIEHIQATGQDVPQVLRTCAEFIEEHGIVDGIYRLSGVTSNIQRLRQEFVTDSCPDLTKEIYLQDIHCVGSLCKLYFRELPNPLLTYQLYKKFTDAMLVKGENEQLRHIQSVVKELPEAHLRTLEYLSRHLSHLATLSHQTNMHARNLALVWAPNLLRSKDMEEATSCTGDSAFMEVRVQQSVVEFILKHTDQIFGGTGCPDRDLGPPREASVPTVAEKYATLPVPSSTTSCGSLKLMSLEEAQARSLGANHPARQRENSLPDTRTVATLYHTVIDLSDSKRKLSSKSSKRWKSIFGLGRSAKLSRNGSVLVRAQDNEKAAIRPSKSMDSICSLSPDDNMPSSGNSGVGGSGGGACNGLPIKSRTLGSEADFSLSDEDLKVWGPKSPKKSVSSTGGSPTSSASASSAGPAASQKALPEQLKVFKGDEASGSFRPTSPKNRRMLFSSSSHHNSGGAAVVGSAPHLSFFPLESPSLSPRHQRKALNISEPFAVSVPLRVSAVISANSTPCRPGGAGATSLSPNPPSLNPNPSLKPAKGSSSSEPGYSGGQNTPDISSGSQSNPTKEGGESLKRQPNARRMPASGAVADSVSAASCPVSVTPEESTCRPDRGADRDGRAAGLHPAECLLPGLEDILSNMETIPLQNHNPKIQGESSIPEPCACGPGDGASNENLSPKVTKVHSPSTTGPSKPGLSSPGPSSPDSVRPGVALLPTPAQKADIMSHPGTDHPTLGSSTSGAVPTQTPLTQSSPKHSPQAQLSQPDDISTGKQRTPESDISTGKPRAPESDISTGKDCAPKPDDISSGKNRTPESNISKGNECAPESDISTGKELTPESTTDGDSSGLAPESGAAENVQLVDLHDDDNLQNLPGNKNQMATKNKGGVQGQTLEGSVMTVWPEDELRIMENIPEENLAPVQPSNLSSEPLKTNAPSTSIEQIPAGQTTHQAPLLPEFGPALSHLSALRETDILSDHEDILTSTTNQSGTQALSKDDQKEPALLGSVISLETSCETVDKAKDLSAGRNDMATQQTTLPAEKALGDLNTQVPGKTPLGETLQEEEEEKKQGVRRGGKEKRKKGREKEKGLDQVEPLDDLMHTEWVTSPLHTPTIEELFGDVANQNKKSVSQATVSQLGPEIEKLTQEKIPEPLSKTTGVSHRNEAIGSRRNSSPIIQSLRSEGRPENPQNPPLQLAPKVPASAAPIARRFQRQASHDSTLSPSAPLRPSFPEQRAGTRTSSSVLTPTSRHRPCSLDLDRELDFVFDLHDNISSQQRVIRDISNQPTPHQNVLDLSTMKSRCNLMERRDPGGACWRANKGGSADFSEELELFLGNPRAPARRNSAPPPVGVASVRAPLTIRTSQAKAVPVVPPKVQYSSMPGSATSDLKKLPEDQKKGPENRKDFKTMEEKPHGSTATATPAPLPSPSSRAKEERENREPVPRVTQSPTATPAVPCSPSPTSPADTLVLRRKHSPNVEPNYPDQMHLPLPASSLLRQRPSFRNRPRPQSLVLFSPPFPIMDPPNAPTAPPSSAPHHAAATRPDRPHARAAAGLGRAASFWDRPSHRQEETRSRRDKTSGQASDVPSKEHVDNCKTVTADGGVVLRGGSTGCSKMTLPKSGQRLETSPGSCFYQPQRRSMVLDNRSSRQIE